MKIENMNSKIEIVARQLDEVFLQIMLKSMFGNKSNIYQSMLQEKVAKAMAAQGGLGLAQHMEKQLVMLQNA